MKLIETNVDMEELFDLPYFHYFPSTYFYHGSEEMSNEIHSLKFRFRSEPKDSVKIIHDAFNEASTKKFGIPIRNLLFASVDTEQAENYGDVFAIIPKGENFRFFTNPNYRDVTDQLNLSPYSFFKFASRHVIDELAHEGTLSKHMPEEDFSMAFSFLTNEGHDVALKMSRTMINGSRNNRTTEEFADAITMQIVDGITEKGELDMRPYESIVKKLSYGIFNTYVDVQTHHYVSDVIEVSNQDTMPSESSEMMLYTPDGFYLVPLLVLNDINR